jgi:hypothetical protein
MTSQPQNVQPPRIAVRLVNLFSSDEEAESIEGDLLEEYTHIASKRGASFARRWYWRQTAKTIAHLAGTAYHTAPWSTTAAIVGGFLLRRLAARFVEPAIFAVIDRYQIFEHHFSTYRFLASTGIDIGHILVFLFVGCVVALGAKGREMVATMTLGFIFGAMAVVAVLVMVSRTGDDAFLWRLTWNFADSFAVVIGGAIVRARRSVATVRPSIA